MAAPGDIVVMVTGYRNWADEKAVHDALDSIAKLHPNQNVVLVHGGCQGADLIAGAYAESMLGWDTYAMPADWLKHGKAAGPIRNQKMIDDFLPHRVVAFLHPDSRGTVDTIERVKAYARALSTRLISLDIVHADGSRIVHLNDGTNDFFN